MTAESLPNLSLQLEPSGISVTEDRATQTVEIEQQFKSTQTEESENTGTKVTEPIEQQSPSPGQLDHTFTSQHFASKKELERTETEVGSNPSPQMEPIKEQGTSKGQLDPTQFATTSRQTASTEQLETTQAESTSKQSPQMEPIEEQDMLKGQLDPTQFSSTSRQTASTEQLKNTGTKFTSKKSLQMELIEEQGTSKGQLYPSQFPSSSRQTASMVQLKRTGTKLTLKPSPQKEPIEKQGTSKGQLEVATQQSMEQSKDKFLHPSDVGALPLRLQRRKATTSSSSAVATSEKKSKFLQPFKKRPRFHGGTSIDADADVAASPVVSAAFVTESVNLINFAKDGTGDDILLLKKLFSIIFKYKSGRRDKDRTLRKVGLIFKDYPAIIEAFRKLLGMDDAL